MFRTRRRAEDARTDAFLAALQATAGHRALLLPRRTDTVSLPRIVATQAVPMGGWQAVAS